MVRNFKMFDLVDYYDIIDDLRKNQLKTLCYCSFLYMLVGGFSYRYLLHSYFALIIFSFIQEYGLSYIKNDINNRFKKLFHKFITNKTIDEVSTDEVSMNEVFKDEVSTDEVFKDEVSTDEVSTDEVFKDEVSTDEVSTNEVSTDEVSTDEVSTDEVSMDEVSTDEVSMDEVSTDEVFKDEKDDRSSYNLRKRHILKDVFKTYNV